MAVNHVILNEYYVERSTPYFTDYLKRYTDAPFLVTLHPQEALLQEARDYQQTEEFRQDVRDRQASEHRLARLVQLGVRQSRFFGRAMTRFQCLMAATVANFTRIWAVQAA